MGSAGTLLAQTGVGTIVGTVTDISGATVPQAHVVLVNSGTNAKQEATTTSSGTYTFVNLPPDSYVVTGSESGFKSALTTMSMQLSVAPRVSMLLCSLVK